MKRDQGTSVRRWLWILGGAALVIVLGVTWPWWYTYILWRDSNTSWVDPAAGSDHAAFHASIHAGGQQRIPKIIHQTWKTEDVPAQWQAAQASCKALHPEYEYRLWTDEASRAFIAEKFPQLLATWDAYPYNIQRADVIRYAVLQELGGFYIDLDIECVRPLDFLSTYPVVLPKTWPVGLSNDFMAAEPGHPFMRSLVDALPGWNMNLWLKYPTVMFSTGPMLVTLKASFFGDRRGLWVLPDDLYNKYAAGAHPLFNHLFGSSWHGEDAKSVLWILHHPFFLVVLSLTGALMLGVFFWRRLAQRGSQRPKHRGGYDSNAAYAPLTEITTAKIS